MKLLTSVLASLFVAAAGAFAAAPANDNKANAAQLSGDTASASVSNVEATKEAGDFANRTLWWKWKAGGNGTLLLDCVNSTGAYLQMAVYLLDSSGNVSGLITLSGSSYSTPPNRSFPVSSGTSYLIGVGCTSSSSSNAGTVKLGLSLNRNSAIGSLPIAYSATMANDNFANRITLTGDVVAALSYTQPATSEAGEPAESENRSLWWQYRPSKNGRLTLNSANSQHSYPYICAFMGSSLNNLKPIRAHGSYTNASISFPVTAGVDYIISYGTSSNSDYGTAILNVSLDTEADVSSLPTPPATMANDSFANRVTLTGDSVGAIAYNYSATTETGEPTLAGNRTFWWSYTPSGNGTLAITTQGSDYSYSAISVYLGSSLSGLKAVAYNANYSLSTLNFPVTGGVTYQIALGSTATSSWGSAVISLSLDKTGPISELSPLAPATMAHDSFANRMQLTGGLNSVLGYTLGASKEALEPAAAGYRTLWYSWTANETGAAIMDFTGSTSTHGMGSIFTGSALTSLTQIPTTAVGTGRHSFNCTQGTVYHICVGESRDDRSSYIVLTIIGPDPVPMAPVFTQHPASKWVTLGQTLQLSSATDDLSATMQWRQDGKNISGADSVSLSRLITAVTQAGLYDVTATNSVDTTTSSVARVGVMSALPAAVPLAEGAALKLSITAKAPTAITYRWHRNGQPLSDGKVGSVTTSGTGSAALSITGVTTNQAGNYTCVLTMANSAIPGAPTNGTSTTAVVTILQKPVVNDMLVPDAEVSKNFIWQLTATQSPTSFVISGLPSGLKATSGGLISGIPNVKGTSKVRVSAKNAVGTGPVKEFTLVVDQLWEGLAGVFTGVVSRSPDLNGNLGGLITVTVASSGQFTGTLKNGTASIALKGRMIVPTSGDPSITLPLTLSKTLSATLIFTIHPDSATMAGDLFGPDGAISSFGGRRLPWTTQNQATDFAGLYNTAMELPNLSNLEELPRGTGFFQMTVNGKTGTAAITGRTGDGTTFTTTSTLWENGRLPLFSLLYSNKGSLLGTPEILPGLDVGDNMVTGDLEWNKTGPISKTDKTYAEGFESVPLELDGYEWVKPSKNEIIFDLPNLTGNAAIRFTHASIDAAAQSESLDQTFQILMTHATKLADAKNGNPCLVTVKVDATKGLFSGAFKLVDPKPGSATAKVTRSVTYNGILLKHRNEGLGVFQLPGLQEGTTPVPTLAGQVRLSNSAE